MSQFKQGLKKGTIKGLLVISIAIALSSCSSMSNMMESTEASLVTVGDGLLSLSGNVEVVQVSEKVFDLTETFYEPVTGFDSWAMRVKAKQVCNEGYIYQSRHAIRAGEFLKDHAVCAEGKACGYALEWRIECKKVPYEPFSLFGKI